jgi:hypothetical protein
VESCYAFATTALAAELHRQHGYRVRFNENPKYPQILELVEKYRFRSDPHYRAPICHNLPMCGRYRLSRRKQIVVFQLED